MYFSKDADSVLTFESPWMHRGWSLAPNHIWLGDLGATPSPHHFTGSFTFVFGSKDSLTKETTCHRINNFNIY